MSAAFPWDRLVHLLKTTECKQPHKEVQYWLVNVTSVTTTGYLTSQSNGRGQVHWCFKREGIIGCLGRWICIEYQSFVQSSMYQTATVWPIMFMSWRIWLESLIMYCCRSKNSRQLMCLGQCNRFQLNQIIGLAADYISSFSTTLDLQGKGMV